jgi:predicted RND superfamily exporter protein
VKPFSDFVIRFRVPIIVATLLVTAVLGFFIKNTTINSDILSYMPKNDPAVKLNAYISERYGGTQLAVVALESDDVFTAEGLARVASLSTTLAGIDGVLSVTSLTDVMDIRKSADGLEVGKLIEPGTIPRTAEGMERLREYVLGKDIYRGRLVSADGKATVVVARIDEKADKSRVAKEIRGAVERMRVPEKVYYAGLPFQLIEIDRLVVDDMIRLIPLAAALIIAALAASFRSVRGVVLPLVAVGISTVWVIGIMALVRVPFSLITNVLPVVLMATGSAYGIHVVSAFNETGAAEDRGAGARAALARIALPVLLAAVTTMAGFLSFLFGSYLTMIREFGLFASLGILLSLIVSLTFVPAVLSLLPAQRPRKPRRARSDALRPAVPRRVRPGLLGGLGGLVLKHNAAMPFVKREVDIISYFRTGTDIRAAEDLMRERFGGSITIQVLVRGDIREPAVLRRMKAMEGFLRGQSGLHNVSSIVEIVEQMNDAMGDGLEIPDSRAKVDNLWFLFEGEEQLDRMVSPDAREAVISATLEKLNSRELDGFVRNIGRYASASSSPECAFQLSGMASTYQKMDSALKSSQIWSLALAIVFMFACNLYLLRSLSGALIGLTPIVFTLFVLFGVMGATGIPLDVATVLIGSISLGMGIDYSIHFLSRYRRELAEGRERAEALAVTLNTTGKAIFINVATVSIGFLALLIGNLIPVRNFGLLIAVTMVSAGIGALTLLPAVMFLAPNGALRRAAERAKRLAAGLGLKLKPSRVRVKTETEKEKK